uniref:PXDN-like protein n=1 Tax=Schmidtea mediterranea TaxID=79327 RepID=A0A5P8I4L0_SCHMD|nr:PXDN-like protein [Schmidtea mediterranea]
MKIPFLLPMLLFILFLAKTSAHFNPCPSVCHEMACQTGVLACTDGGLLQIPPVLHQKTHKIIVSNQRFSSPHLTYSNFSNYGPPNYKIEKIALQFCELVSIASNCFSHLTDLRVLDLSHNLLGEIPPDTFKALHLQFLRLDDNKMIQFHRFSFRGLNVAELSLFDCNLTELDFEVFSEISERLKKLILTNNKLNVIDKRFRILFENLPDLQINENPFNCTCNLRWLNSVLVSRKKAINLSSSKRIPNQAQCNYPDRVKGKQIADLDLKDFDCDSPRLKLIDVFMTSTSSAKLTCISEPKAHSSPDVIWMTEHKNTYVPEIQSIEKASLSVLRKSRIDKYKCVIKNNNDYVTVVISIHWPVKRVNNASQSLNTLGVSPNDMIPYLPNANSTLHVRSVFYEKQFTLLEMIGGVVGTFTITMILFLCIYRHLAMTMKRNDKKKWYLSYETAIGSDSQTYDIPNNTAGLYFPGQLLTNPYSPARYLDYNSHTPQSSPNKVAAI